MLVVTRRFGEEILILDKEGKQITKMILVQIKGKQVRLGFQADKEIQIHRKEAYDPLRTPGSNSDNAQER